MKHQWKALDGYQVPALVEFWSYLCLALLLIPACPIAYAISGQNLWFSAFGLKVYAQQNLLIYTVLAVFPFMGGVAALGILRRRSWGLLLAAAFCAVALLISAVVCFMPFASGLKHHSPYSEIIFLLLCLLWIGRTLSASTMHRWPARVRARRQSAAWGRGRSEPADEAGCRDGRVHARLSDEGRNRAPQSGCLREP